MPDVSFSLVDDEFQRDPTATFAALRERCPVHHTDLPGPHFSFAAGGRRGRGAARRIAVVVEVRPWHRLRRGRHRRARRQRPTGAHRRAPGDLPGVQAVGARRVRATDPDDRRPPRRLVRRPWPRRPDRRPGDAPSADGDVLDAGHARGRHRPVPLVGAADGRVGVDGRRAQRLAGGDRRPPPVHQVLRCAHRSAHRGAGGGRGRTGRPADPVAHRRARWSTVDATAGARVLPVPARRRIGDDHVADRQPRPPADGAARSAGDGPGRPLARAGGGGGEPALRLARPRPVPHEQRAGHRARRRHPGRLQGVHAVRVGQPRPGGVGPTGPLRHHPRPHGPPPASRRVRCRRPLLPGRAAVAHRGRSGVGGGARSTAGHPSRRRAQPPSPRRCCTASRRSPSAGTDDVRVARARPSRTCWCESLVRGRAA